MEIVNKPISFKKKTPFSKEETTMLVNIVEQDYIKRGKDPKWSEIAEKIPNKNARQCKERWLGTKKPKKWTIEEDELLLFLKDKYGNRWTFFSNNYFGNINPSSIRSHYNNIKSMSYNIKQFTKDRISYIINNQNIILTKFQKEINQRMIFDDELINRIIELTYIHVRLEGVNTIIKRPIHEASLEEKKIIWDLKEKYKLEFETIDRILFNNDGESSKFYNEYLSIKLDEATYKQNSNNKIYQGLQ